MTTAEIETEVSNIIAAARMALTGGDPSAVPLLGSGRRHVIRIGPPVCPYKAWTGHNIPTDARTLWEEFARLSGPTFSEFAADRKAARDAVYDAAIKADRAVTPTPA